MGGLETWPLGTAIAMVERTDNALRVRLQGVVTAMTFESVHVHLAHEMAARRELVLDHDAVLAVTCRSAVEASVRATPAGRTALVHVGVPRTRMAWALEYSLLMTRCGLARWPFELPRVDRRG